MAYSGILTDYIGTGLAAARPATPNVGPGCLALYRATDTGALSAWTGAAWVTLGGGTVTSVTAGAGLSGGPITAAGTLAADWHAGVVSSISTGLNLAAGVLTATAAAVIWNAGTVTAIGNGIEINSGTISADTQGTIAATATGTINPAGLQSAIVNMGTVNTTLTVSPGYQGQHLRLEIKQGATAHTVALDSSFAFGADIPSFTATASANARDLLQLICCDGTHWAVAAVNKGFTI